jgi:hypothetical protein
MGHACAPNPERFRGLFVQVNRDTGKGAFGGHSLAIVPIEHGAPRVRVAVPHGTAEHGEANVVWIFNKGHGVF